MCCTVLCCIQVRIVREKLTGKIMAMKKLKKAEMLRRGQVRDKQAAAAAAAAGWMAKRGDCCCRQHVTWQALLG
jgi:hypothetical protein